MPRFSYAPTVKKAIISVAVEARRAGKSWDEAFDAARRAGYLGSPKSLQKMAGAFTGKRRVGRARTVSTNKNGPLAIRTSATPPNVAMKADAVPQAERKNQSIDELSNALPVLRDGTHYARQISLFDGPFQDSREGEIVAWARILDREEALCVVNSHNQFARGADVIVDSSLNPPGSVLTVVFNTAQNASAHPVGSQVPVQRRWDGTAFVAIRDLAPAESLLLINRPAGVNVEC